MAVYTTIDDPSAHFHTQLYTGNGASSHSITNNANAGDFKPDWLWVKNRSSSGGTGPNIVFDTTRGNTKDLHVNNDEAEHTNSNVLLSFDTDGFSVGTSGVVNNNTDNFVAWQWIANGGSTTTNDASSTGVGTIDSVYQANTTAGFSIVTHTGSNSAGTIAHGLGVAPKWVLTKNRTDNGEDWANYHVGLPSAEYYIRLNTNAAQATGSSVWGDTAPSSTVITFGGANGKTNAGSSNYVHYCFAPIQGYSKFGSYTGNANADGPFVYTGFKPAWVLIKRSDGGSENWNLNDNKRSPINPTKIKLSPNTNGAEAEDTGYSIDFVSNGFKIRNDGGDHNSSGATMIYMAFAEHPFVSSKGVPVTAR